MKNIIIATLVTLLTISSLYQMNLDSDSDFEKWTLKYGKKFYGDEKIYRQTIYYQNKKMIEEHNSRNDVTYQMRENQFMSITNEEFIKLYLNQKLPQAQNYQNYVSRNSILDNQEQNIQLRGEIDWIGVVTVKNQGQCGSSWAVAASSVVEADFAIKQNIKVILSPLWIVLRVFIMMHVLMRVILIQLKLQQTIYIHMVYTEQEYPYNGKGTESCNRRSFGDWKIYHYKQTEITGNSFIQALAVHPLEVQVDAALWQFYGSGVFSDCSDRLKDANYFALAVDQGYAGSQEWWYVQASFGSYWGESGSIRLASGNTCGIKNNAWFVDTF